MLHKPTEDQDMAMRGSERESKCEVSSERVRPEAGPIVPEANIAKTREHISILLVDDHAFVREALAALLDRQQGFRVIGQCGTGIEAVEVHAMLSPDITLMDINLPDISGLQAIRRILAESPSARIAVISTYVDRGRVLAAQHIGGRGFIPKTAGTAVLCEAILTIFSGGLAFPPEVDNSLRRRERGTLGRRELEVLELLADGESNQEIARNLSISVDTVKSRIQVIFQKLETHSRTEAVVLALEMGLIMGPGFSDRR